MTEITDEEIAATTPEKARKAANWLFTAFVFEDRTEGEAYWVDLHMRLRERAKDPS